MGCGKRQLYTGVGLPAAVQFKMNLLPSESSSVSLLGSAKAGGSEGIRKQQQKQRIMKMQSEKGGKTRPVFSTNWDGKVKVAPKKRTQDSHVT